MSRKDTLKTILTRRAEAAPAPAPTADRAPPHVVSGVVGAMGRSLGHIVDAAERARALVASADAVVEIAADRLAPSFVRDRMGIEDGSEEYRTLLAAIRDVGQRSPILVRPLPQRPGFYQIVFGHRRAHIAAALGRPVKAVVQGLSDDEVVVVQGQENAVRKDLSFIERALFAATLEERGFGREVIVSALGTSKSRVSELLSLVRTVTKETIEAIGPAPKKGRPKWQSLAARIAAARERDDPGLERFFAHPDVAALTSDERFEALLAKLAARDARPSRKELVTAAAGEPIARLVRTGSRLSVIVDDAATPDFGAFLAARLPDIFRQFQSDRRKARRAE
jgi:ParB family chromosome partitioning protein